MQIESGMQNKDLNPKPVYLARTEQNFACIHVCTKGPADTTESVIVGTFSLSHTHTQYLLLEDC